MTLRSTTALLALTRRAAGLPGHLEPGDLPDVLVRRHGLGPLACALGVERFRPELVAAALRVAPLQATAAETIATLSGTGIPVALIKGISYAAALYRHPSERPMADVDLLVPGERFADACASLARQGLRPRPAPRGQHALTYCSGSGIEIDLHRSIVPLGWARIDESAMWARARPAGERTDGALRMDPIDETLLQCLVLARRFWGALIGYVDLLRLLARLDPSDHGELLARARQGRVLRLTAAALQTAARIGDVDPPRGTPLLHFPLPSPERIAQGTGPGPVGRVTHRLGLSDSPRELLGQLGYYAARGVDGLVRRGGAA